MMALYAMAVVPEVNQTRQRLQKLIGLGLTVGCAVSLATFMDAGAACSSVTAAERPFLAESQAAMDRMMGAMVIRPSGDVDGDFAAMMIAHHQGAIEMAQAELLHGHNERLRRIAQEIIVDQQQEIAAMHLAVGQPPPPSAPAPDQFIPRLGPGATAGKATP